VPPSNNQGSHASKIEGLPPGYVYIHIPVPGIKFFNHDTYPENRKQNKDFDPDLLTDEGPSTG